MVLRIFKVIANSGFLTALECTKFVFGRGSGPDPTGRAYSAPPDLLAGIRALLLRERKGEEGEGRENWEGKRRGKTRVTAPVSQISGSAPGEGEQDKRGGCVKTVWGGGGFCCKAPLKNWSNDWLSSPILQCQDVICHTSNIPERTAGRRSHQSEHTSLSHWCNATKDGLNGLLGVARRRILRRFWGKKLTGVIFLLVVLAEAVWQLSRRWYKQCSDIVSYEFIWILRTWTIFSWMFTIACCFVVGLGLGSGLGLGLGSGWLVVMRT